MQTISGKCSLTGTVMAVLAAIVLLAVIAFRLPVPVGYGRAILLDFFKIGLLILFFLFLWFKISRFAAGLLVIGFISSIYPARSDDSVSAFQMLVLGICWYAALMVLFDKRPELINYVLCLGACVHAVAITNGGHLMTNPNEETAFFAMCVPSFLLLRGPLKLLVAYPIFAMFLVPSFNGILAVGVTLFVYSTYRIPHLWYVWLCCAVTIVALFWVYIDRPEAMTARHGWLPMIRLSWWREALRAVWYRPFGCGLGHWQWLGGELARAGWITKGCRQLHNTWIQGLVEMGVQFGVFVGVYAVSLATRLRGVHIAHVLGIVVFFMVGNAISLFQMNIVLGVVAISLLVRIELAIRSIRPEACMEVSFNGNTNY